MAKKIESFIKMQIPGGAANPAPPVGPALGQHGVNIMEFCKAFNAKTQENMGKIIPVEITVFADRSFTFITKTPPTPTLILEAVGVKKGSGEPNREKIGSIFSEYPDCGCRKALQDSLISKNFTGGHSAKLLIQKYISL